MTSIFDSGAAAYDAWYDSPLGAAAFAEEVVALRPLVSDLRPPLLEVGVGTGRFAQALGVRYGVDPALGALQLAVRRGVHVARGVAEALPFVGAPFGGVVIALTLCFVADPLAALHEARRVLRPDGAIALGVIPAEGIWGSPVPGARQCGSSDLLAGALLHPR